MNLNELTPKEAHDLADRLIPDGAFDYPMTEAQTLSTNERLLEALRAVHDDWRKKFRSRSLVERTPETVAYHLARIDAAEAFIPDLLRKIEAADEAPPVA